MLFLSFSKYNFKLNSDTENSLLTVYFFHVLLMKCLLTFPKVFERVYSKAVYPKTDESGMEKN